MGHLAVAMVTAFDGPRLRNAKGWMALSNISAQPLRAVNHRLNRSASLASSI